MAAQNGIPWWYFHKLEGPYEGRRIEAVDPDGEVSRVIPPERAIGCVVFAGTELAEPGVVRHNEGTRFSIGEPDGSISERCERFSEAMVAGGLKCPVEERLRDDIWVKLMGNVAFNPLSVLTRATLEEMCSHAPTRALVASIMEEALEIAAALGAEPSISIERRLNGRREGGRPQALHAAGPRGGQAAGARRHRRQRRRAGGPHGGRGAQPARRGGGERPTGGDARAPLS